MHPALMILKRRLIWLILMAAAVAGWSACRRKMIEEVVSMPESGQMPKTDAEWKKKLTPEQYRVLREKGTERAFTGAYHDNKEKGVYVCAACGAVLFRSQEKFDSGTGWPSFWAPAGDGAVAYEEDRSLWTKRTEVHCKICGGHQGHVFDDGPPPTGKRYCINSAALKFIPEKQ